MFSRRPFFAVLAFLLTLNCAFAQQPTGGVNLRGVYPMDAVAGSTWSFVGGVAALTKKWANGPLFDVIGKDAAIHTIYAVNGYPDIKKLAGLMGINYKTGIFGLLCTKVYDQSGNGNNVTAATPANTNQPGLWLINGKLYFGFGGILTTNTQNNETAQYFTFPSGAVAQNNQSNSIFSIISPYTTIDVTAAGAAQGYMELLYSDSIWVGGLGDEQINGWYQNFDLTSFNGPALFPPNVTIGENVFSSIMGPSSSTLWVNEGSNAVGAQSTGSGSFVLWGYNTTSPPFLPAWGGRVQALMISSTVFTTAQASLIRQALYGWGGIKSQTSKLNIVIDGASIDQNQGGDPSILYNTQNGGGYGWAEMLKDYLQNAGYNAQLNNFGIGSQTLAQMAAGYPAGAGTFFNAAASRNIYFGFNSAVGNTLGVSSTNFNTFTGSIVGSVLTVATAPSGSAPKIQKGMAITGTSIPGGITVTTFGTGTGGTGTYNLSGSAPVASETITATYTGLAAYNDFLAALTVVKAQSWNRIITYLFSASSGPVFDYNTLMLANATSNGITCIQIQNNTNPGATAADGIHPSVIGYQGYLSSILPQLLPMLFN